MNMYRNANCHMRKNRGITSPDGLNQRAGIHNENCWYTGISFESIHIPCYNVSIMNKKRYIVTHANPDLDAVCAVWLIKRFWNGWETSETMFVPAGETLASYRKKASDAYLYEGDLTDA